MFVLLIHASSSVSSTNQSARAPLDFDAAPVQWTLAALDETIVAEEETDVAAEDTIAVIETGNDIKVGFDELSEVVPSSPLYKTLSGGGLVEESVTDAVDDSPVMFYDYSPRVFEELRRCVYGVSYQAYIEAISLDTLYENKFLKYFTYYLCTLYNILCFLVCSQHSIFCP